MIRAMILLGAVAMITGCGEAPRTEEEQALDRAEERFEQAVDNAHDTAAKINAAN